MNGSKDAFDRFVDTYYGKLFRYSFTVCGQREDAEEIAQETLMKVFDTLDQLKPPRNGAGLEIADWSALPDDLAADSELHRALTNAIQQLPEMYRTVFLLRDIEELSTEATAHVLEVTEDVVKQRLHRARLALRKSLDVYAKEMK